MLLKATYRKFSELLNLATICNTVLTCYNLKVSQKFKQLSNGSAGAVKVRFLPHQNILKDHSNWQA